MGIPCTPRVAAALVAFVQTGASLAAAAAHVGVPVELAYHWVERGRRASRGRLREFARAIDAAREHVRARVAAGGPLLTADAS